MSETKSTEQQKPYALLVAFALGVALAALVFAAWPKISGGTQPTDAPTQAQGTQAGQEAESASADPIDIAATFPSWDPESASLAELVAFVHRPERPQPRAARRACAGMRRHAGPCARTYR